MNGKRFLAIATAMAATALPPADASAAGWTPARGAQARYGLISVTCEHDGHTSICLGLACRRKRLELVSAAGGGGPMDGATTLGLGGRPVRLSFKADDRAIDVLGIAASRARVSTALLEALAEAKSIRLTATGGGEPALHLFSTRNLADEIRRAAGACR